MNVDGYLRRFINIEYRIPIPEQGIFVNYLFDKYGFEEYFNQKKESSDLAYEAHELCEVSENLFSIYGFSLRTQEQIFSQVCLVLRTTPNNYHTYPGLLMLLLCIRSLDSNFYNDLITRRVDGISAINSLKENPNLKNYFENGHYGPVLEAYLLYALRDEYNEEKSLLSYKEIIDDQNVDESAKYRVNRIISVYNNFLSRHSEMMKYLSKKIEILHNFRP